MKALVDLGLQESYISACAVLKARLRLLQKRTLYLLHVANRQLMPKEAKITHEVTGVTLRI
jgi:hypothetical protein